METVVIAMGVVLIAAQVLAWRWSARVERRLAGKPGFELARIVSMAIGWSVLPRVINVVHAALFTFSRPSGEVSFLLTFVTQVTWVAVFILVGMRVRAMSLNQHYAETAEAWRTELREGVDVKVDQVGGGAAVAVDDAHGDASAGAADANSMPPKPE